MEGRKPITYRCSSPKSVREFIVEGLNLRQHTAYAVFVVRGQPIAPLELHEKIFAFGTEVHGSNSRLRWSQKLGGKRQSAHFGAESTGGDAIQAKRRVSSGDSKIQTRGFTTQNLHTRCVVRYANPPPFIFFYFFSVPRISLHSALCTHSVRSKLWCCRDVAQQRGFTRSILRSTRVSYRQAVAPTRTYCHLHSLLGSSKVGRVLLSLSGTWHVPCCTLKPPNTVFEA